MNLELRSTLERFVIDWARQEGLSPYCIDGDWFIQADDGDISLSRLTEAVADQFSVRGQ